MGKLVLIRQIGFLLGELVLFGGNWSYLGKRWLYLCKGVCFWQKWLYFVKRYFGESRCIRANRFSLGKLLLLGQQCSKVVAFGQKWLYLGKSWLLFVQKWLNLGKLVLFRQIGSYWGKLVLFRQKVVGIGQN